MNNVKFNENTGPVHLYKWNPRKKKIFFFDQAICHFFLSVPETIHKTYNTHTQCVPCCKLVVMNPTNHTNTHTHTSHNTVLLQSQNTKHQYHHHLDNIRRKKKFEFQFLFLSLLNEFFFFF